MPKKLSAFRIFRTGTSEPVDALLPYTLHTPLFSDYAEKHRLIWVPPGQQASTAADGHIDFPIGSLIVKSFGWPEQNGGRPVRSEEHTSELQSLMRISYAVFCLNKKLHQIALHHVLHIQ